MKLVWPGSNIVPGWMVLARDEAATIVTNDLGASHLLGGAPHNLGVVCCPWVVIELLLSHPSSSCIPGCPAMPLPDEDVLAECQSGRVHQRTAVALLVRVDACISCQKGLPLEGWHPNRFPGTVVNLKKLFDHLCFVSDCIDRTYRAKQHD